MTEKINDITIADNPILNNPYIEPQKHYDTNSQGNLDYGKICTGRRLYKPDIAVIPVRQSKQKELLEWNEDSTEYENHFINLCRAEVGKWRKENYPNTTRISKELLSFWFANPERENHKKLFFAQQEAVETAIWLNEVAQKSNSGQYIMGRLQQAQKDTSDNTADQLPRIAFKMATGSGKTVVMACLILYHYFNRQEYGNDTRFVDNFLIVAPGVTIKDRLGVLFVDSKNKGAYSEDYYHVRDLVPSHKEPILRNLNARLVITNYHSFEPKQLQGNKRSPFDGKVDLDGKKIDTGNKEDFSRVVKRLLGNFKLNSRLLILNDEAHHCYLPKSDKKTLDNEEDENARAAVWFSGLRELAKRFTVRHVYDLSATPYYLNGSGYTAYSLFPWVVSDFGLIEAIESGLVKIPFLPEEDNSQELTMPVLRNLYEHVKEDLPKKGQRKKQSEAVAEGKVLKELPPQIPALVKLALDQFYNHYIEYDKGIRKFHEANATIFSSPPVFIVVCNNTSVSKEVYKYIAGYEFENAVGEIQVVTGAKALFSNYHPDTKQPLKKPPTLLIDSAALEDGEQINDDFKKIFAPEIAEFKKDYARLHGQGSSETITDGQLLREVVNTVGKQGKLGAHIRCVVSVSMLTEGWDSNTVTHIMGLRAFGSQLLCEQVAGRALRRMDYFLQGYDKDGNPTKDKRKIVIEKFPPEYAHIIGVPFKLFKGGKTTVTPPTDFTHIGALPERKSLEITFPNIIGYRLENYQNEILFDFNDIEDYEVVCSQFPLTTTLASAFSAKQQQMQVKDVFEIREQEIQFLFTKELLKVHFSDDDRNAQFQHFNTLLAIVKYWYAHKVRLIGESDTQYKKLLYFEHPKKIVDHIVRGINPQLNTVEYVRPMFNYYNSFSSTHYVNGNTVKKELYETKKSHVNFVVMDSDWEGIAAKTLEQLDCVESYVKNHFLGFAIPYSKDGKEKQYYPDFIARVKASNGTVKNLMIEISGMSQDKAEKKWFVENRWLPAVNAVKDKHALHEWAFIEIAADIRDIKNQLLDKIEQLV
jgi:type III restriction enzyme